MGEVRRWPLARGRVALTRRTMLLGAAAFPAVLPTGALAAPGDRAAVVIGVNQTGDLPPLNAAVSDANRVGDWLDGEGFEVTRFVDDTAPVEVAPIHNAISALVRGPMLDQLVVYFSGHGFVQGYGEFWLLTDAPGDVNAAVSLDECLHLARDTGIANVVFISDACRSTAASLQAQRVRGSVIFPNDGSSGRIQPEVDIFYATRVGEESNELPVGESIKRPIGLFTDVFLDAYAAPAPEMVKKVGGIDVVPNRALKCYLQQKVPERLARVDPLLEQHPAPIVESDWTTYIGRVTGRSGLVVCREPAAASMLDNAVDLELERMGAPRLAPDLSLAPSPDQGTASRQTVETFLSTRAALERDPGTADQGITSGLAIHGTRLRRVLGGISMNETFQPTGDGIERPAVVALGSEAAPAASLIVEFEDGGGAVLPVLADHVGSVTVEKGVVTNVAYVPGADHRLRPDYDSQRGQLDKLRAIAAAAARVGAFRFDGPRETREAQASAWANQIRPLDTLDPTLGLYAAYAYSRAGLAEHVLSVLLHMREELGAQFFDNAMLARLGPQSAPSGNFVSVPFCPLLAEGWNLLRITGMNVPESVAAKEFDLRPGLWTTFGPVALASIVESAKTGALPQWGRLKVSPNENGERPEHFG